MSVWSQKRNYANATESAFNEAIGGNRLPAGTHIGVSVSAVELAEFNEKPVLEITWEKDGLVKKQSIWLLKYDDPTMLSTNYLMFGAAVCGDRTIRRAIFLDSLEQGNSELLYSLVGVKANITIGLPKKGTTIKRTDNGEFILADVVTGMQEEGTDFYASLEEAKTKAKELGFRLSYDSVQGVMVNHDAIAKNEEILRKALSATASGNNTNKGAKAAGTRPAAAF